MLYENTSENGGPSLQGGLMIKKLVSFIRKYPQSYSLWRLSLLKIVMQKLQNNFYPTFRYDISTRR